MPAHNSRGDHSEQVNEITCALNLQRMPCLYDFSHRTMGFYFFSGKDELIINVEHNQQGPHDHCPLGKQTQRELERHTPEKPQKQRWIAEWGQQPGGITDDEYEENDQVS